MSRMSSHGCPCHCCPFSVVLFQLFCLCCHMAVLSSISCPGLFLPTVLFGCLIPAVPFRLSRPGRPVPAVLSRLSRPACPVPPVPSRLSCPACPVPAVRSWLSCPICPAPVVLSRLSCPCCPVMRSCHALILAALSTLSGCPFPAILSQPSCPCYPAQHSCHNSPIAAVLSCWHVLAALSTLSYPG